MRDLRTRVVVLLGRRPSVDWDAVRGGLCRDDELVVLSLGYPVTGKQRGALLEAQELAAEAGAWFDALLVTSTNEMAAALQPGDEVHVAAAALERRRLRNRLDLLRG